MRVDKGTYDYVELKCFELEDFTRIVLTRNIKWRIGIFYKPILLNIH